jgi:Nup85 Nucleoporin
MNNFTADYSSSPAAETPAPRRNKTQRNDLFFTVDDPEPASTTPLVPPPSSLFGSSRFGPGSQKPLFQKSSPARTRQTQAQPALFDTAPPQFRPPHSSAKPPSRLFQTNFNSSIDSTYSEGEPDGPVDDELFEDQGPSEPPFTGRASASLMRFSTTSRRSMVMPSRQQPEVSPSKLPRLGQPDFVPGLARDFAARSKPAGPENDDLIIDTEMVMQQLYDDTHNSMADPAPRYVVDEKAHELLYLWQQHAIPNVADESDATIGPPAAASSLDKAYYVASLLLTLHHPSQNPEGDSAATPRTILDWLESHHVSYELLYRTVVANQMNVTASELFWDAILSLTLRGKLSDVMRLLAEADFKYAATSRDDGAQELGYRGTQLQTIQTVIYRARQILNECPASSGNWETTSEEWERYRANVQHELDSMANLVVDNLHQDDDTSLFGRARSGGDLLGRQSQNSRSLPLSIYQGIRTMLNILLGSSEEIVAQSQDWLEATCALTVWWDGGSEEKIAKWTASVSHASSRTGNDKDEPNPYLDRIRESFLCVTDPGSKESFPINTLSVVEIGVGCALQGSVQGVITILKTLSLCLTSAIAEVGSAAGWLEGGSTALSGLNSQDLMVLSYGGKQGEISKDDILQDYALSLFAQHDLQNPEGGTVEGWELSLGILRRMDDADMMQECVADLLNQLEVTEVWRAEKIINLCTDLNLREEARKISERFGDHLVNNTNSYGLALLCYARSHSSMKIQQLTDLLISYSLVQSRAYPTADEMDNGLHSLVDTPKTAFSDIADTDPDAASHLQFYMVGYACIRRFYSLRDEELSGKSKSKSKLAPAARKRAAAKALIAAINSAADSIYGGLYDGSRQSAIQVESLLPLLGEATALLPQGHESGVFTSEQLYALLAAIEDLETVSERVFGATEECLQASVRNYSGSAPPSPRDMLKKSMSSGTNSNFSFSMMGSEMLARSTESGGGKSVGSAVLVKGPAKGSSGEGDGVQRGWDWRSKFKGKPVDGMGREVLRELRKGIAEELSIRELEGN